MHLRIVTSLLAAALLAAVGCKAPPLAPEPPLPVAPVKLSQGEWRVVDHVFVVTDASGTMYSQKTFPKAKALAESFVLALPDPNAPARDRTYNAAAIGFGGDERVALGLQPFDRNALKGTVEQVQVMGAVDGRGGRTPIHKVIAEIGAQLEGQHGPAAVVLFTDGEPDDAQAALAAAQQVARSYRDGVCFHGVQVGNDPAGERFLRELAEISSPCGSYRNAATVQTADALAGFTRGVVIGKAPSQPARPAVAAANACEGVSLAGVLFKFDSDELVGSSSQVLDRVAEQLKRCPDVRLRVEGHTDVRGPATYNQKLSERRAQRVRDELVRRGVPAERLQPLGLGEADPLDTSGTEEGHQRNRRVDLVPVR